MLHKLWTQYLLRGVVSAAGTDVKSVLSLSIVSISPTMLPKEPEAQETQLVAPADAYHLPASHALHVLMPVLEYLPVSQGVQVPAAPPPTSSDTWMSQYFYLCTSSCVSICTVVLANLYSCRVHRHHKLLMLWMTQWRECMMCIRHHTQRSSRNCRCTR